MKLNKKLILGSNSPRRKEILALAGYDFEVIVKPTDEHFDSTIPVEKVPVFLAKKKSECFIEYHSDTIVLCADTVVIIEGAILNKPANEEEAMSMLKTLSGKMHLVVTGISIKIGNNYETHADVAEVYFDNLTDEEIRYYVSKHKPFDKAGSYGVQDFIGMIGIPKINGSFYTVMGLPIHLVYQSLKKYMVL